MCSPLAPDEKLAKVLGSCADGSDARRLYVTDLSMPNYEERWVPGTGASSASYKHCGGDALPCGTITVVNICVVHSDSDRLDAGCCISWYLQTSSAMQLLMC